MRFFFVCLAVNMIAGSGVAAEAISETHKQAALDLLNEMEMETTMVGSASVTADFMIEQNPVLAPYRDVLINWAASFLTWETFAPKMVEIYADSFTESELRELSDFYQTPVGKKTIRLLPELMNKGMMIGAEVAEEHRDELEIMIRKRAAELEKAVTSPSLDA